MKSLTEMLALYLASLPQTLSARTLLCYRDCCSRFCRCVPAACAVCPTDLDLLSAWQKFSDREWRPRTLSSYRERVCLFLDHCVRLGHLPSHPLRSVPVPDLDAATRPKISLTQFRALLDAAQDLAPGFHRERGRAVLYVLFTALLRRAELLALRVEHLRLAEDPPRLFVYLGKGHKSCWLPISDACAGALRAWLAVRPEAAQEHGFVFCGHGEQALRMWIHGLGALLRSLARGAHLEEDDCLPHAFRRGGATAMLQSGVDIGTVSKQLRHASIGTTLIYLEATVEHLAAVRNWMGAAAPVVADPAPAAGPVCRDPQLRPRAERRRRMKPVR